MGGTKASAAPPLPWLRWQTYSLAAPTGAASGSPASFPKRCTFWRCTAQALSKRVTDQTCPGAPSFSIPGLEPSSAEGRYQIVQQIERS
jgi:hypothetical protein